MAKVPLNQFFPGNLSEADPATRKTIQLLFERVNFLLQEVDSTRAQLEGIKAKGLETGQRTDKLDVALASVQDAQTQGSTLVGQQGLQLNPTTTVTGSGTGYSFTQNSAGALVMTVASAPTARSAIGAAQATAVGAGSVALAKLTPAGTDGSISYNADGCITAVVAPT